MTPRGVLITGGLLLLALTLGGCGDEPAAPDEPTGGTATATISSVEAPFTALRLDFEETLPGGEPTTLRMLVTPGHLRIDSDDAGDSGFILYDRVERVIFSVSEASRTIIVIPYVAGEITPELPFTLDERRTTDPATPATAGRSPLQVDFLADGKLCYSTIAVVGLLSEAQAAEREYLETLAAEQRRHVDKLPEALRDPCDLSRHVFAPVRHLAAGYPVQFWDPAGYRRRLLGFDAAWSADPALFTLPEGYERYEMGVLR